MSIKIPNVMDDIQFYIPDGGSAELWKECIDKASVTNLKQLITQQELMYRDEIKLLKEEIKECRLMKDESLYELCAAEQERDKLKVRLCCYFSMIRRNWNRNPSLQKHPQL